MSDLPCSIACERNREPILACIAPQLVTAARVVEIGSGTGYLTACLTRPEVVASPTAGRPGSGQGDHEQNREGPRWDSAETAHGSGSCGGGNSTSRSGYGRERFRALVPQLLHPPRAACFPYTFLTV
jgi:hypothetical protein